MIQEIHEQSENQVIHYYIEIVNNNEDQHTVTIKDVDDFGVGIYKKEITTQKLPKIIEMACEFNALQKITIKGMKCSLETFKYMQIPNKKFVIEILDIINRLNCNIFNNTILIDANQSHLLYNTNKCLTISIKNSKYTNTPQQLEIIKGLINMLKSNISKSDNKLIYGMIRKNTILSSIKNDHEL